MRIGIAAVVVLAGLAVPSVAFADEIHVPGDFRSLQKAVDAAQPGDTIVIDKGRHVGPFEITTDGLTIEGRGGKVLGVAKRRRGVSTHHPALEVSADRLTVRNLTFVRSGIRSSAHWTVVEGCTFLRCDEPEGSPHAISIRGHRAVVVDNLIVGGMHSLEPIYVEGDDGVVEGNTLERHRYYRGLVVRGNRVRVNRNSVSGVETQRAGILVSGTDALVEANEVGDFSGTGSGIVVNGYHPIVRDNLVDGSGVGGPSIFVEGTDGVVEDNEGTAAAGTGIVVSGDRNRILRNRIAGVVLFTGGLRTFGHGIVARGNGNVLAGNFTAGTPADGIRIVGGTGNEVDDCECTGSDACGILNAADGTTVTGSTFLGNGTDVVNGGSFTVFDGNEFDSGSSEGTEFGGSTEPGEDFGIGASALNAD